MCVISIEWSFQLYYLLVTARAELGQQNKVLICFRKRIGWARSSFTMQADGLPAVKAVVYEFVSNFRQQ